MRPVPSVPAMPLRHINIVLGGGDGLVSRHIYTRNTRNIRYGRWGMQAAPPRPVFRRNAACFIRLGRQGSFVSSHSARPVPDLIWREGTT